MLQQPTTEKPLEKKREEPVVKKEIKESVFGNKGNPPYAGFTPKTR